jgi:hypothetical protein
VASIRIETSAELHGWLEEHGYFEECNCLSVHPTLDDYEPHVRQIGEEKKDAKVRKRHKARRWVVERTIGWLNRCRGILIRYEKKAENYLAVVQLACALLWFRRLHRLTT